MLPRISDQSEWEREICKYILLSWKAEHIAAPFKPPLRLSLTDGAPMKFSTSALRPALFEINDRSPLPDRLSLPIASARHAFPSGGLLRPTGRLWHIDRYNTVYNYIPSMPPFEAWQCRSFPCHKEPLGSYAIVQPSQYAVFPHQQGFSTGEISYRACANFLNKSGQKGASAVAEPVCYARTT